MEREKKECILSAAAKAFSRFGFKKTSVDDIAKDAGVAKGTVYLAADSKEDLFYQAVHREVRAFIAELSKQIDPRKRADELLMDVARESNRLMEGMPLVRDLFVGLTNGQFPEWERLDELRSLGRTAIQEIVRLGVRQGVFAADVDVESVAEILQEMEIACFMRFVRDGDREAMQRRQVAGLDLILNGLRQRQVARAAS
jgi:TetR/AcrR family transcriptional regulator, cholesterol catabolism regulator